MRLKKKNNFRKRNINTYKTLLVSALLLISIVVIFLITFFIIKTLHNLDEAEKNSYQATDNVRYHSNIQIDNEDKGNLSVLILGMDQKNQNSQRTDSIILATYNEKNNKVKMVRIPRDLYIKTDDYEGKINSIYDQKGLSELINVVQDYTGVTVDKYVSTDFQGLTKMVDQIGGIDIDSEIKIDDSNNEQVGKSIHIRKGRNHLNGKEALAYSRIRYIDNDIKRGDRQQEVIKAIVKKTLSPSQIPSLGDNLKAMSHHVKTDFKIKDLLSRANSASGVPDVQSITFKWDSFSYKGQDFVYVDNDDRSRLSAELRENIGLKKLNVLPYMSQKPNDY